MRVAQAVYSKSRKFLNLYRNVLFRYRFDVRFFFLRIRAVQKTLRVLLKFSSMIIKVDVCFFAVNLCKIEFECLSFFFNKNPEAYNKARISKYSI